MKRILFWKYADLVGQLLMLLPIIYILSPDHRANAAICYVTVGIWQSLSCAITAISGARPVAASRRFYGLMLAWILGVFTAGTGLSMLVYSQGAEHNILIGIATICQGIALVEATAMLFLLPVMAVWYVMMTVEEITALRAALHHRSEIHWKL